MSAGPLAENIANTFRGGSYTATTLAEETTLYRTYGGSAGKLGGYWTRVAPTGPAQAQLDLALNPAWGNTATKVASIQVPAGTTIFEGFAAPQATATGQLLGGGSQVFIPRVDPGWLVP
jgi:filamentous hemagglutinin